MVAIINAGEAKAADVKLMFKGVEDYNPSLEIEDIRLAPGWYLMEGNRIGTEEDFEGQTRSGIIAQIKRRNMIIPNFGRIVKCADTGCKKAVVGEYVLMPAYGGNGFDDKKAMPLVRELEDPNDLWVIHEDFIFAVIPEAADEPVDESEEENEGE